MYNGLVLCTGKNKPTEYISKSSLLTLFLIISGCPLRQQETSKNGIKTMQLESHTEVATNHMMQKQNT